MNIVFKITKDSLIDFLNGNKVEVRSNGFIHGIEIRVDLTKPTVKFFPGKDPGSVTVQIK